MESNTSGHGEFAEVPNEIRKWNWGAFWLTWIWGICNKSYIALLALLPVANLIMHFYLGAKGNELAWKNKEWDDAEDLLSSQRIWAIVGWIIAVIFIVCMIGTQVNKYNEAKETERIRNEVVAILKENKEVKELVGKDFSVLHFSSGINLGNEYRTYNVVLQSNDEFFLVICEFNEDNKIKNIKVSPFDDNKTEGQTIIIRGNNDEKEN